MPSRLVEISASAQRANDLDSVLSELDLTPLTREAMSDKRLRVRLLLDASRSGAVVDHFQRALGSDSHFYLVILPVEASLPRPLGSNEEISDTEKQGIPTLPIGISREELYADVKDLARLSRVFVATTFLSAIVAIVGMLRDNVAVIIGAMVIAPLLGPNVAMALGTTLGDSELIRRSLRSNIVGMALSLVMAIVVGIIIQVDPTIPAIRDRTMVHLSDLVLALASGSAGTLALTTGLPLALVGVMVAVALLPPTIAVGLMLGDAQWALAGGACALLLANVICVNLAGVLTFLAQGVQPLTWWETARARRATTRAIVIWIILLVGLVVTIILAGPRA